MKSSKTVSAILKLWVLALAVGALYYIWADRTTPPLASQVEQDEEIARTDVAVKIGAVQRMTLHGFIIGYGSVEPAPTAQARVTVDWPAAILEVTCAEGQHVDKGQTLFFAQPANTFSATGQTPSRTVTSPISGTVVSLDIHTGEVALPTTTAVKIVDLNHLVAAINIPAWQAAVISVGQQAEVEISTAPAADPANSSTLKFDSKVERIDSAADPKTNLVSVDITIPPGKSIRPGQFARVAVIGHEQRDCLAVPADSIVRDSLDRPFVAMVSDDHKQAILRPVEPGLRDGDWVQIIAPNIESGQTIVVSGAYGLLFKSDIKVLNP